MKNILLILLAAAGLCSCERFLTNGDPNKIDAPTYFRNESDLEAYANGFLQTMIPPFRSPRATPMPITWLGAASGST